MSRNVQPGSQLLSIYYKIIPYRAHLLNVIPPMGIKFVCLLENKVGKKSKMHQFKRYKNRHLGFLFWPCSHSFESSPLHKHGHPGWTSPLHSSHALLTGLTSKSHRLIEGWKFKLCPNQVLKNWFGLSKLGISSEISAISLAWLMCII